MSGLPRYIPLVALPFGGLDAVQSSIIGRFGRFPPMISKKLFVLQLIDLNMQRPAALDHLGLTVTPEPPGREISTGAGT
jgi:hypothetical protein